MNLDEQTFHNLSKHTEQLFKKADSFSRWPIFERPSSNQKLVLFLVLDEYFKLFAEYQGFLWSYIVELQ